MISTNKTILYNILSTVLLQGMTFISAPIISRMLGPANYGLASVYVTWIAIYVGLFNLQTSSTIAVSRKTFPEEQKQYQSSILTLSLASYIVASVVVLIFSKKAAALIGLPVAVIPLFLLDGLGQIGTGFSNLKFTYEFKALRNLVISLITIVATLGLSIFLISWFPAEENYWGRIIGLCLPHLAVGAILICQILFQGKTFYNKVYWSYCLALCLPVVLHRVSGSLLSQSGRILLQKMMEPEAVGIYSLAFSFSTVLTTIWSALNNSWVPYYYEYMRKKQTDEMFKRVKYYMELFTVLSIGFVLLATEVYHVFAGSEYWSGGSLIPVFAIGHYFVFLYSFPVNYEFFHEKTKTIATGSIIAAVCNILFGIVCIYFWGIFGAAIAVALAYVVQMAFHQVMAGRIAKKSDLPLIRFKAMLPYLLVFSAVAIICSATQLHWAIRWGIGAAFGIAELIRIIKRKAIF